MAPQSVKAPDTLLYSGYLPGEVKENELVCELEVPTLASRFIRHKDRGPVVTEKAAHFSLLGHAIFFGVLFHAVVKSCDRMRRKYNRQDFRDQRSRAREPREHDQFPRGLISYLFF
jgi:hypothetical protein